MRLRRKSLLYLFPNFTLPVYCRHPEIFSQRSPIHEALIKSKVQEGIERLKWVLYQDPAHSEHLRFLGQNTSYEYEQLNIYDEDSKSLQKRLVKFLTCGNELLCLSAAKLLFELFKVNKTKNEHCRI